MLQVLIEQMNKPINRKQTIDFLGKISNVRVCMARFRAMMGENDDNEDFLDLLLMIYYIVLKKVRYLVPRLCRKFPQVSYYGSLSDVRDVFTELSGHKGWLNDREFRSKYRVPKETFLPILDMVKRTPVFLKFEDPTRRGPKMRSVAKQLGVFLCYLGRSHNGASQMTLRDHFRISTGAVALYCERVLDAMMHLQPLFLKWHGASEKNSMSDRMNKKGFPECVGIMHGTLFPLQRQPERTDHVDFFDRHHQYSLSTMIVCNDRRQILLHDSGWPGSVHDQRVFKHSELNINIENFLDDGEYIIADAGYANTNNIITSYKMPPGESSLPQPRAFFNRVHASARVKVEHTIGLLKGRFPILRGIPIRITQDNNTILDVIRHIEACIILHNILNTFSETDCKDWMKRNKKYNKKKGIKSDLKKVYVAKRRDITGQHPNNVSRELLCTVMNRNPLLGVFKTKKKGKTKKNNTNIYIIYKTLIVIRFELMVLLSYLFFGFTLNWLVLSHTLVHNFFSIVFLVDRYYLNRRGASCRIRRRIRKYFCAYRLSAFWWTTFFLGCNFCCTYNKTWVVGVAVRNGVTCCAP
jgi:hypothetical protein